MSVNVSADFALTDYGKNGTVWMGVPYIKLPMTAPTAPSSMYDLGKVRTVQDKLDQLLATKLKESDGNKMSAAEAKSFVEESGGIDALMSVFTEGGVLWTIKADTFKSAADADTYIQTLVKRDFHR